MTVYAVVLFLITLQRNGVKKAHWNTLLLTVKALFTISTVAGLNESQKQAILLPYYKSHVKTLSEILSEIACLHSHLVWMGSKSQVS